MTLSISSPTDSMLVEIYRQNWEHARHQETQRLAFASIYSAIVAGTLALVFKDRPVLDQRTLLMFLLFVVAVFGLAVTLKWNGEFHNHIKAIEKMKKECYMNDPRTDLKRFITLPLASIKPGVGWVFVFFYSFLAALWLSFSVWYLIQHSVCCSRFMIFLAPVPLVVRLATLLILLVLAVVHNEAVEHRLADC